MQMDCIMESQTLVYGIESSVQPTSSDFLQISPKIAI